MMVVLGLNVERSANLLFGERRLINSFIQTDNFDSQHVNCRISIFTG